MPLMSDNSNRPGSEPTPEQPRAEPEIIPPGRRGARPGGGVFIYVDEHGNTRRATLKAPGPFAIILALLIVGLIAAVVLVALLGLVLIWIPVVVIMIAALVLSGTIRAYWRRLRGARP
jgi:Flp pilus assembly protein TadB